MNCELCQLEKKTKWYYEDKDIVVCDCTACKIPQVIWKKHSMTPSRYIEMKMVAKLSKIAREFYGNDDWYIDTKQRKIKDHLHWHARPKKKRPKKK
tara:strand:- start:402 stop:689 length:288 start_codon:yes stop_codon:yes gene_type:complete